jgi:hypothetical protein
VWSSGDPLTIEGSLVQLSPGTRLISALTHKRFVNGAILTYRGEVQEYTSEAPDKQALCPVRPRHRGGVHGHAGHDREVLPARVGHNDPLRPGRVA